MTRISHRLRALEKALAPAGQYLIYAPASYSTERVIAETGIAPRPDDTVVVLQTFIRDPFTPFVISGPGHRPRTMSDAGMQCT